MYRNPRLPSRNCRRGWVGERWTCGCVTAEKVTDSWTSRYSFLLWNRQKLWKHYRGENLVAGWSLGRRDNECTLINLCEHPLRTQKQKKSKQTNKQKEKEKQPPPNKPFTLLRNYIKYSQFFFSSQSYYPKRIYFLRNQIQFKYSSLGYFEVWLFKWQYATETKLIVDAF